MCSAEGRLGGFFERSGLGGNHLILREQLATELDSFETSRGAGTTHEASLLRRAPSEMEFLDIVKKDLSLLLQTCV
jgi:hypothetical protein